MHFFSKIFGQFKKKQYFCRRFRPRGGYSPFRRRQNSPIDGDFALGAVNRIAPSGGGQFPRLTGTLPGAIV